MPFFVSYLMIYLMGGLTAFVESLRGIKASIGQRLADKGVYLIMAVIVLAFTIHFVKASGDYVYYHKYMAFINGNRTFNIDDFLYAYELGFSWLAYLVARMWSGNVHLMVVVITIVPIIFYILYFKYKSVYPLVSLVIYVAHFHWWLGFVLIRQMYAVCFLLVALHFLARSKWLPFLLFIGVAALFHSTVLTFLILPLWLKYKPSFMWQNILIILMFVVGKMGITGFIGMFLPFLERGAEYERYLHQTTSLNILSYLEMYVVFLLLSHRRSRIGTLEYKLGLNLSALVLIICGFFINFSLASRLAMYFNFYVYLIVFPQWLKSLSVRTRLVSVVVMVVYLFVFLFRFIVVTVPSYGKAMTW